MTADGSSRPPTETVVGAGAAAKARNGLRFTRSARWGAWYVTEHRLHAMRSYKWTVVFTAIGSPLVYLIAFGIGLASLVSANLGENAVDGVSYLEFVAPALLMAAAFSIASEEFMFLMMLGFKWNPTFYGMNSAPLTGRQIVDGIVLFVVIRMTITCVAYYIVLVLFGAISSPWGVLMIPVGVLTGLAFGAPLMAYSSSIREDKQQFSVIFRLIVLPLTLFSGTMFPLESLPIGLQWIGWISPLWHGAELGRQVSYGPTEPFWLSIAHVGFLVALVVIGWAIAVRVCVRRLDK
jgi:lipooligosaccharide transport system permease protein